jgi:2-oxoglutarate/2-oxoacid ferredoxin oxidoreductase subunit beta
LLYVDRDPMDLHHHLQTVTTPFNALGEAELCPGSGVLEKLNGSLR